MSDRMIAKYIQLDYLDTINYLFRELMYNSLYFTLKRLRRLTVLFRHSSKKLK
jgi:hypothetical protein